MRFEEALKWDHIVVSHVFKRVRLKGVWLKLNKYGIFLKNNQNTAWKTTIWFHFSFTCRCRAAREGKVALGTFPEEFLLLLAEKVYELLSTKV